jgi:hypothetical protein
VRPAGVFDFLAELDNIEAVDLSGMHAGLSQVAHERLATGAERLHERVDCDPFIRELAKPRRFGKSPRPFECEFEARSL